MTELTRNDVRYVVQRLPRDIREMLSTHAGKVFVGGGFVRATIAGEVPSDIDVFGHEVDPLLVIDGLEVVDDHETEDQPNE